MRQGRNTGCIPGPVLPADSDFPPPTSIVEPHVFPGSNVDGSVRQCKNRPRAMKKLLEGSRVGEYHSDRRATDVYTPDVDGRP